MKRNKPSWRRLAKFAMWFLVDSLVKALPSSRRGARTLVIRLDNIGDFVIWLASAERLAAHFRTAGDEVILLASSAWSEWASELAIFDQVLSLDRKRYALDLAYRFRAGRMVRKLGCSTVILPGYSRSWASGDAIVRVSGAKVRIASQGDPLSGTGIERRLGDAWFTDLLPANPEKMTEFERNAEFMSNLLQQKVPVQVGDLRALRGKSLDDRAASSFGVSGQFYVLFPGASDAVKCWPTAHFQEIARRVYAKTGWTGVVGGGPGDKQRAKELAGGTDLHLVDLAGRTTLSSLTDILAGAKFLVSNDTSAVHMAASLSVPTVCILGGGHVDRFLPYPKSETHLEVLPVIVTHPMDCFDCNWECIYHVPAGQPTPCVEKVALEDVWRETQTIIDRLTIAEAG